MQVPLQVKSEVTERKTNLLLVPVTSELFKHTTVAVCCENKEKSVFQHSLC